MPEPLEPLKELFYNIGWYWNVQATHLLYRLDRYLCEEKNNNPVSIFGSISHSRLEALAKDEGIIAQLERVKEQYNEYMTGSTWYSKNYEKTTEKKIAFFSLEFGLAECLPIYPGGLGILAGDHLKSASDLGRPSVGMGLLYQEGYFRQYLNNDGWQQEQYIDNDFYNMPVLPVFEKNGKELKIELEYPDGPVYASESLIDAVPIAMECKNNNGKNYIFEGNMPFVKSGRIGYSLRILPLHPDMALCQDCKLIKWA